MTVDNDQEQEIVLGNKQLLSLFFVVVVLLGVAFTIGYMMGKNAAPATTALNGSPALSTGPSPGVPPSRTSPQPPGNAVSDAPSDATNNASGTSTADNTPPPDTQPEPKMRGTHPAKDTPAPAPSADATPVTDATAAPAPSGVTPPYLQVAAIKREDADHLVQVLRKRSFPALLGESPKPGLFRVLVGPFKTMQDLAESKQKLKAAGFDTIVAR